MYTNAQYEAQKEHLRDIYRDSQNYQQAQEALSTQYNVVGGYRLLLNKLWQRRPRFNLRVVRHYPKTPMAVPPNISD